MTSSISSFLKGHNVFESYPCQEHYQLILFWKQLFFCLFFFFFGTAELWLENSRPFTALSWGHISCRESLLSSCFTVWSFPSQGKSGKVFVIKVGWQVYLSAQKVRNPMFSVFFPPFLKGGMGFKHEDALLKAWYVWHMLVNCQS